MQIEEIIKRMSLKEKIEFCTGGDMWHTKSIDKYNVESIMMTDGPHGLRCQRNVGDYLGLNDSEPSTCFPSAVSACNTFDIDLINKEARAIAKEAKHYGVSVVLGPGCNIKRNPLGGRNFEYFSEDPYLAGKMAASFILGVESENVGSSLKHFACNNQEYKRQTSNSIIDERTLREIYLKPFEIAIKEAKPSTVMCSYNKINNVYSSDNSYLLNDILRKEWGFDGTVVTDWGAMNNRIEAFKAGCDINMPGGSDYMVLDVLNAVKNNLLSEDDIDNSVRRILKLIKKFKGNKKEECDFDLHHNLAVNIATQGAVLLKNDNFLPVNKNEICLIGHMAKDIRYQGSGSSHINPTRLIQLTDLLKDVAFAEGVDENGNLKDLEGAINLAKSSKKVIAVIGLPSQYESESFDRDNMKLPQGYIELIDKLVEVNKNVAVILLSGSCIELPFKDKVKAILYMGLAGQGTAKAIYDLILGKKNPSGKLSETWPIKYDDVISKDYFKKSQTEYREGIYVGYRYYDKANIEVAYPFGYGLSYSNFEYSDLKIEGNNVSFNITNVSNIEGKEVVQLYIAPKNNDYREIKKLVRFTKVNLASKETKRVEFTLDDDCFSIYQNGYKKIKGDYDILVCSSSKDVRLQETITIDGVDLNCDNLSNTWYKDFKNPLNKESFEILLNNKIIEEAHAIKGNFTMNNSCYEMKDYSFMMKMMYFFTKMVIDKSFKKEERTFDNPSYKMMLLAATDCPLRSLVISSGGMMKEKIVKGLLLMANGHMIKGISCMING